MSNPENNALLNPEVQKMVVNRKLTPAKIRNLIVLKKMVDRLAGCHYVSDDQLETLLDRFGVAPDIITWGDFFQAEVAADHWEKSDDEFTRIIQTISYDLIAAILIFTEKSPAFLEEVRGNFLAASGRARRDETDEEAVHLGILLDYFSEMKLRKANLTDQDFSYFGQFAAVNRAVS